MSTLIRVVLIQEPCGNNQKVWVAQALEIDMATQGEIGGDPLDAVEALGWMFDVRDWVEQHAEDKFENPPAAPVEYAQMWANSFSLGEHPFGKIRRADVRMVK